MTLLSIVCTSWEGKRWWKPELALAVKNFFLEKVSIMRICSHCGIEYPKRDFTAHNAHCKGKDLVTCHICGKEVTSKTNLTKHISWVHGIFKKKEYKKDQIHTWSLHSKILLSRSENVATPASGVLMSNNFTDPSPNPIWQVRTLCWDFNTSHKRMYVFDQYF